MDKICIIDKRKVILIYILLLLFIIGMFISVFYNVMLIPSLISYALSVVTSLKYIVCSNCNSTIMLKDVSLGHSYKYCKHCGVMIECR
ncbi:MAG: hypothetical protein RRZ84_03840 [Romboutsia sp.]